MKAEFAGWLRNGGEVLLASCGTCHVPSHAFTSNPATDHGLPVPLGGPNMDQTGFRKSPSLMYALFTPPTFGGGQAPTLNAQEIDDIVAFLCTLTDGFDPSHPQGYDVPAQCQPIASTSTSQGIRQ